MLQEWATLLQNSGKTKEFFYIGQIVIGVLFLIGLYSLRDQGPKSQIKAREEDLKPKNKKITQPSAGESLADARIPFAQSRAQPTSPLRLSGISISGPPHEILGVNPNASSLQIQKAHRDLMKHYHPDQVGRPGSQQWKDAQKIASAINNAKEMMLKQKHK